MNKDFTYCTIKYKHCKKQRECKHWLANYDEETQMIEKREKQLKDMENLNDGSN